MKMDMELRNIQQIEERKYQVLSLCGCVRETDRASDYDGL